MRKWYAVQVWDEVEAGYGSTIKREAIKKANAIKRDSRYDGKQIRIVVFNGLNDNPEAVPVEEIIIREGER